MTGTKGSESGLAWNVGDSGDPNGYALHAYIDANAKIRFSGNLMDLPFNTRLADNHFANPTGTPPEGPAPATNFSYTLDPTVAALPTANAADGTFLAATVKRFGVTSFLTYDDAGETSHKVISISLTDHPFQDPDDWHTSYVSDSSTSGEVDHPWSVADPSAGRIWIAWKHGSGANSKVFVRSVRPKQDLSDAPEKGTTTEVTNAPVPMQGAFSMAVVQGATKKLAIVWASTNTGGACDTMPQTLDVTYFYSEAVISGADLGTWSHHAIVEDTAYVRCVTSHKDVSHNGYVNHIKPMYAHNADAGMHFVALTKSNSSGKMEIRLFRSTSPLSSWTNILVSTSSQGHHLYRPTLAVGRADIPFGFHLDTVWVGWLRNDPISDEVTARGASSAASGDAGSWTVSTLSEGTGVPFTFCVPQAGTHCSPVDTRGYNQAVFIPSLGDFPNSGGLITWVDKRAGDVHDPEIFGQVLEF